MQTTLVALYGPKNDALCRFILDCQAHVANMLQERFRPYAVEQIHATLFGLERDRDDAFVNRNWLRWRGRAAAMDFAGVLEFLRGGDALGMRIRLGGFENRDYPFTSRGERPYDRAFSLQGQNVVVMGWPVSSDAGYPLALDRLRSSAQRCNVLHAYHRNVGDVDNDFFFRIGIVDTPETVTPAERHELSDTLRRWLAARPGPEVDIGVHNVAVVAYASEELPVDATTAYRLDDPRLTAGLLRSLY